MRNYFLLLIITLFLASCSASNKLQYEYASNSFDVSHVKANLEFLASDDLKGRNTATESEKVASQFIASEFKKYGLEPFGDDGTYFQNIDFVSAKYEEESYAKIYDSEGNEIVALKLGEDFMTSPSNSLDESVLYKDFRVVFAGYGITADEYKYDDYKDIDVSGKVVLVMTGEPYSEDETYFNGGKDSRYANPFSKIDMANAKGAAGVFIIPNEQYLQYWPYLKRRAFRASLSLPNSDDVTNGPSGLISMEGAQKILENEIKSFDSIQSIIASNESLHPFDTDLIARFELKYVKETKLGRNVVAILPGSNPALQNDYITIGAHYDHVGVNAEGETYNGADDNGSGTVSVMEAARLLSQQKNNERPIVFLLYTGEEKGLLGSKFFVQNFSTEDIVVNINVDMTGRESLDSIHVIGSDRVSSQFYEMIKEANLQSVNYFLDYSLSDTRLFRQSDHYTFAKANIPVVFFFDNMRADLHRTSDDVEKINFSKICKTAHLVSQIALKVANLDERLSIDKQGKN